MPVYDHSYKTWSGERLGPFWRWSAIPKFAYMEFASRKIFIVLFAWAWMYFLAWAVVIFFLANLDFLELFEIPEQFRIDVGWFFFKSFLDSQLILCFPFAFILGANLISRDRQHSALVLFATKPISRIEYFVGKLSILFGLMMLLTWFQAMMLFSFQWAVSDPFTSRWRTDFWSEYGTMPFAITAYSLLVCLTLSMLTLAASSMAKSGRYAGMILFSYIVGTIFVSGFMVELTGDQDLLVVSILACGIELGNDVFGLETAMSPGYAWAGIIINNIVAAIIIRVNIVRSARYGR